MELYSEKAGELSEDIYLNSDADTDPICNGTYLINYGPIEASHNLFLCEVRRSEFTTESSRNFATTVMDPTHEETAGQKRFPGPSCPEVHGKLP